MSEEVNRLIQGAVSKYFKWFPPNVPTFEDAVQECWIAYLESNYEPEKGELSTFIFQVVKRKYQNLLRDANRDRRSANNEAMEFVEEIYDPLYTDNNMSGRYEKRYKAWQDGFYDDE